MLFTRNYFITKSHQQINVVANLLNVYNVGKVKKNLTINVFYELLLTMRKLSLLECFEIIEGVYHKQLCRILVQYSHKIGQLCLLLEHI